MTPDGRTALTGSQRVLSRRDLASNEPVSTVIGHYARGISLVALSPDASVALTAGYYDSHLLAWDATSSDPSQGLVFHQQRIDGIGFDASGDRCASLDWGNQLLIWNTADATAVASTKVKAGSENYISLTSNRVLTGAGHDLQVRDVEAGGVLRSLPLPNDVHAIALSPDGRHVFATVIRTHRRPIIVLDADTGKELARPSFNGHCQHLSATANERLLIASDDGLLVLWDLAGDREVARWAGPGESLAAACTDPTGSFALTATRYESTLALWDLTNGACLASLRVTNRITALGMVGRQAAFGDDAGRMHFLQLSP